MINVALKELQEKDSKIQQLTTTSRDATQVQVQLCEEVHLKEDYTRKLSEAHVLLFEEKMRLEAELKSKEASLGQSDKCLLEVEALLRHEQD